MEFSDIAASPWVRIKLTGNREHEDYLLGSIDRREYIKKMADIARNYAAKHLGIEGAQTARIYGKWSLIVNSEHGVGFEVVLTLEDTPTHRASFNPQHIFLPADYAFANGKEREAWDRSLQA